MDYGSITKRFGNYILNDPEITNESDAKLKINQLFQTGSDEKLNPFLNFTRGKIMSKKFVVDNVDEFDKI